MLVSTSRQCLIIAILLTMPILVSLIGCDSPRRRPPNGSRSDWQNLVNEDFQTISNVAVEHLMRCGVIDRIQEKSADPTQPVILALGNFRANGNILRTGSFVADRHYRSVYRLFRERFTNVGKVSLSAYIFDLQEKDLTQDLIEQIRKEGFNPIVDRETMVREDVQLPSHVLSGEYTKREILGRNARCEFEFMLKLIPLDAAKEIWLKTVVLIAREGADSKEVHY